MNIGFIKKHRLRQGLTQSELAKSCGLFQPELSSYEQGNRQLNLERAQQILQQLGFQLVALPIPQKTLSNLADEMSERLIQGATTSELLRMSVEFADSARLSNQIEQLCRISQEPPSTGSSKWDAFIAGVAEWVSLDGGLPAPLWSQDESRSLDEAWFLSPYENQRAFAFQTSPGPFRARCIYVSGPSLASI